MCSAKCTWTPPRLPCEADLRAPEADPRAVAGHHPDRLAVRPAVDDRQPERAGVERLGRLEVDDFEHEFAHPVTLRCGRASVADPCATRPTICTAAERARLAPHFTNARRAGVRARQPAGDGQGRAVRALLALPGHAAAAVPGRVRGLAARARGAAATATRASARRELYERIFVGYGDDSVAQLGGAHVACEWVSNILTKMLQRPRLAAYLEQSTRYIAYDAPMPGGGYRYYRDADARARVRGGDGRAVRRLRRGAAARARVGGRDVPARRRASPEAARRRAVKAKALDLLRGLLPAASLSHMGIYATGQAYEQLILHLLAPPAARGARATASMILDAIKAVMPSFVSRVERPDRGDEWVAYLSERRAAERALGRAPRARPRRRAPRTRPSVRLLHVDGDEDAAARRAAVRGRRRAARSGRCEAVARARRRRARARCSPTSSASARNRRHRPGRGFEALRYRFEIVSDYGAFRDLQRHRMLTVQWQPLTPDLGAERARGGRRGRLRRPLRARARALARRVRAARRRRPAPTPRRTRSASATGSATCSTSTPARRCT